MPSISSTSQKLRSANVYRRLALCTLLASTVLTPMAMASEFPPTIDLNTIGYGTGLRAGTGSAVAGRET